MNDNNLKQFFIYLWGGWELSLSANRTSDSYEMSQGGSESVC